MCLRPLFVVANILLWTHQRTMVKRKLHKPQKSLSVRSLKSWKLLANVYGFAFRRKLTIGDTAPPNHLLLFIHKLCTIYGLIFSLVALVCMPSNSVGLCN